LQPPWRAVVAAGVAFVVLKDWGVGTSHGGTSVFSARLIEAALTAVANATNIESQ
jgi:hypothetical protein